MAEGWGYYGIEENPFEAPDALHCLRRPEDWERFSRFLSLAEDAQIDAELKAAIKIGGLASFVVTGRSGSGRTAFARHLVARYATFKKTAPDRFAFAEYDPEDNVSVPQVLHALVTALADEAKDLSGALEKDPSEDLHRALAADPPASFSPDSMQSKIRSFSKTMGLARAAFGCLLDNATSAAMLIGARKVFEKADGILVCTVNEAVSKEVLRPLSGPGKPRFREISLPHLTPRQTWQVLELRWEKWKAPSPIPMTQKPVEDYVAVPPPTIGWLLTQLSMMFQFKLRSYQGEKVWPHDPAGLGFTEQEVRDALAFVRECMKKGGVV
jgi:hypothetical protein